MKLKPNVVLPALTALAACMVYAAAMSCVQPRATRTAPDLHLATPQGTVGPLTSPGTPEPRREQAIYKMGPASAQPRTGPRELTMQSSQNPDRIRTVHRTTDYEILLESWELYIKGVNRLHRLMDMGIGDPRYGLAVADGGRVIAVNPNMRGEWINLVGIATEALDSWSLRMLRASETSPSLYPYIQSLRKLTVALIASTRAYFTQLASADNASLARLNDAFSRIWSLEAQIVTRTGGALPARARHSDIFED